MWLKQEYFCYPTCIRIYNFITFPKINTQHPPTSFEHRSFEYKQWHRYKQGIRIQEMNDGFVTMQDLSNTKVGHKHGPGEIEGKGGRQAGKLEKSVRSQT